VPEAESRRDNDSSLKEDNTLENFTPLSAIIGGLLIGTSATLLLMLQGRIAGISGIIGGLMPPKSNDAVWRVLFVIGLIAGAAIFPIVGGDISTLNVNPYGLSEAAHLLMLVAAGLLVGFGTQIGSGCTSGHGVCGLGRLSARSLVATATFMAVAGVTVFVIRSVTGG